MDMVMGLADRSQHLLDGAVELRAQNLRMEVDFIKNKTAPGPDGASGIALAALARADPEGFEELAIRLIRLILGRRTHCSILARLFAGSLASFNKPNGKARPRCW